jgi:hypothetical protein
VETVASGLATFDYDGDGLIDIYFLNGRPLRGTKWQGPPPTNRLYRNLGGFRFADVTDKAGVGDAGYGLGVAVGDYDNDGLPDIYVNNYGPNVLYRNNGDATFTDVTQTAGVGRGDKVGAGADFLDIDGDGNSDLFVANYIAFSYENHVTTIVRGMPFYSGPRGFPKQPNQLFRNNGDGIFREISAESGIGAHAGSGMGTIALDYDNDGRTDIFVCNDEDWNFLFRNEGAGKFREVALAAGVSCNSVGEPVAGMGADAADYDHGGRLGLFVTDFQEQNPILYQNLGGGAFEDVTMKAQGPDRSPTSNGAAGLWISTATATRISSSAAAIWASLSARSISLCFAHPTRSLPYSCAIPETASSSTSPAQVVTGCAPSWSPAGLPSTTWTTTAASTW